MSFFSFLGGAFVGFVANFVLRAWQNERERWISRVDEFCDVLHEATDLAVDYWLKVGVADEAEPIQDKREILMLGYQSRLDGLITTFLDKLQAQDRTGVENCYAEYRDALTGGQFLSRGATPDKNCARNVVYCASELFVCLRQSADRAMQRLPGSKWHEPRER